MEKKNPIETKYEIFLRKRAEEICHSYLEWSQEIMSGQVKPNRVIQLLAQTKGMSGQGVKSILIRRGVYKSAQQPIILPSTQQLSPKL